MGLSFSVLAMLNHVSNCVSLGFLLKQNTANINILLIQTFFKSLASIFAMCGAFLVTKMEIRFIGYLSNRKKNQLSRLKVPLKDLILSMVFMIILIIIASFFDAIMLPMII